MIVADAMTRTVLTATPSMPIDQAARLMLDHRVSGLPVLDANGTLVGIVTEADLMRRSETGTLPSATGWRAFFTGAQRLAEDYVRTHGRSVEQVMSRNVISVSGDTPLVEAVALMESRGVKRLPVVDHGQLVGILSRADLLRALQQVLPATPSPALSDAGIHRAVLAELRAQRLLPAAMVDARVRHGTVELRGVITSDAEREALRVLVQNVPGVREVIDRLVWIEPYTGMVVELPPEKRSGLETDLQ
jgi:CBS domain-containing protein